MVQQTPSLISPVHFSGTFHRLFGGKASKQAPVTTAESMKNSTVISNPHATLNHVTTVLESPDGGVAGVDSDTNSPLFGGRAHGSGMGTLGSEQVRDGSISRPTAKTGSTGELESLSDSLFAFRIRADDVPLSLDVVCELLTGIWPRREHAFVLV